MIIPKQERGYIASLRRDPRTKAMFDGWVAQATQEAEMLYPDLRDDRQRTHFAAERAVQLAMSHVLDNDGELQMLAEENDRLRKQILDFAHRTPPNSVLIIPGPAVTTEDNTA